MRKNPQSNDNFMKIEFLLKVNKGENYISGHVNLNKAQGLINPLDNESLTTQT